jgi:hypothetical protein
MNDINKLFKELLGDYTFPDETPQISIHHNKYSFNIPYTNNLIHCYSCNKNLDNYIEMEVRHLELGSYPLRFCNIDCRDWFINALLEEIKKENKK